MNTSFLLVLHFHFVLLILYYFLYFMVTKIIYFENLLRAGICQVLMLMVRLLIIFDHSSYSP